MHSKKLSIQMTVLLICTAYLASVALQRDLFLYIHPRYIMFTTTMTFIAAAFLVVRLRYQHKPSQHDHTHKDTSLLQNLPLLIILLIGLGLPARSLTSATAEQRSLDGQSVVRSADDAPINALLAQSSRGLALSDWARLLEANSDPSYYQNKTAVVSGFVYAANLGPDTFQLSRFVVTCCAVDAQPIGVPVATGDWGEQFEEDQWLEVEGEFKLMQTAEGMQLVLTPTSVTSIEEPENPYAT